MLSKSRLKALQNILPFKNYDQLLQDYILEKALYHISQLWFEKVILIGGTALSKFYGVPRFSKDIDIVFVGVSDKTYRLIFRAIREKLVLEGFSVEDVGGPPAEKECWYIHAYEISAPNLGTSGLLIEIRRQSNPINHHIFEYVPVYPDIFEYKLRVATLEEILKEKIEAIHDLARDQVRDLFDVYYITKKYGFDIRRYVPSMEKFCKISKALLRDWNSLEDIVFVDLPKKDDVLQVLGCL